MIITAQFGGPANAIGQCHSVFVCLLARKLSIEMAFGRKPRLWFKVQGLRRKILLKWSAEYELVNPELIIFRLYKDAVASWRLNTPMQWCC